MTLPQILRILWARRRTVALAAAIGLGLALAASLLLPKSWRATAEVYLDLGAADAISGTVAPHAALAAMVATQADVIASVRVAETVVRARGLDRDPVWSTRWREATGGAGDPVNWIAQQLLVALDVQADANGSLVRVNMTADAAQDAADLANAFVEAYLNTALELRAGPAQSNAEFFASGTEAALDRLARAKARLSDYQRTHNVIDVGQRVDVENERLSALTRQLVSLRGDTASANARVLERNGAGELPEVLADPVVQNLRQRLSGEEAQLRQMSERLGSAHPQRLEQESLVQGLRAQLRREISRRQASVGVAGQVSAERVDELERAIEAQRARVLEVKGHQDQIDLLRNEVAAAQKAYELVSSRGAVSALESQLRQTQASVLTAAVAPLRPVSPKPALNLAVGTVLGLLIGAAVALARESSRPMVRTLDDLAAGLGLPVLATLPSSGGGTGGGAAAFALPPMIPRLPSLPRLPGKGRDPS